MVTNLFSNRRFFEINSSIIFDEYKAFGVLFHITSFIFGVVNLVALLSVVICPTVFDIPIIWYKFFIFVFTAGSDSLWSFLSFLSIDIVCIFDLNRTRIWIYALTESLFTIWNGISVIWSLLSYELIVIPYQILARLIMVFYGLSWRFGIWVLSLSFTFWWFWIWL